MRFCFLSVLIFISCGVAFSQDSGTTVRDSITTNQTISFQIYQKVGSTKKEVYELKIVSLQDGCLIASLESGATVQDVKKLLNCENPIEDLFDIIYPNDDRMRCFQGDGASYRLKYNDGFETIWIDLIYSEINLIKEWFEGLE